MGYRRYRIRNPPQNAEVTLLTRGNQEPETRFFHVASDGSLILEDITLNGGLTDEGGGAINNVGTLTINSSKLSRNSGTGDGVAGALWNRGTATIIASTLSHNDAEGCTIWSHGTLTLIDSTIMNNTGRFDTGLCISGRTIIENSIITHNDGGAGPLTINDGLMTVSDSTISHNRADGFSGAGLSIRNSMVTVSDSNISHNIGIFDGGGGLSIFDSDVTVRNSTISHNTSDKGGGILHDGGGAVILEDSILALNTATTNESPDCSGAVITRGATYIGNPAGCTILTTCRVDETTSLTMPGSPALWAGRNGILVRGFGGQTPPR